MDNDDIYNITIVGTGETTMEFDKAFRTVKDSIKISLESPMGLAIK